MAFVHLDDSFVICIITEAGGIPLRNRAK